MPPRFQGALSAQTSKLTLRPSICRCRFLSSSPRVLAAEEDAKPSHSLPTSTTPVYDIPKDGKFSRIFEMSKDLVDSLQQSSQAKKAQHVEHVAKVAEYSRAASLEKQMTRRWKAGDVYAPHDLSHVEMQKWNTRTYPNMDAFDALAMNPIEQYKNFSVMSEYMTQMGRIRHSKDTGLRPVNQRRVAKAIRRAIGIGIMPSVHHHPQLLEWAAGRKGSKARKIG